MSAFRRRALKYRDGVRVWATDGGVPGNARSVRTFQAAVAG
ncbi:hypothetical protein [Streptomyces lunaelactis]|nr:hypothetical protein [Streptomyces lunaelactis]